jgi:excisionase family DNA binding protein
MSAPKQQPVPKIALNVSDAARALSIGVTMMRRLAHTHEIPYLRIGNRLMFSTEDLEHFVSRNRVIR